MFLWVLINIKGAELKGLNAILPVSYEYHNEADFIKNRYAGDPDCCWF